MKKTLQVAMHLLFATGMCVAACGGSDSPYRSGTWAIDCVAVVGMPVSELTPLSAVPYSGVPREKLIKNLTDEEIGRLSDFMQCLSGGGYHAVCVEARGNRVEGPEVLTDYLGTCFRTPFPYLGHGGGSETREEVSRFLREYYGACGVGITEDCSREMVVGEFPVANTPSCTAWEQSCIF